MEGAAVVDPNTGGFGANHRAIDRLAQVENGQGSITLPPGPNDTQSENTSSKKFSMERWALASATGLYTVPMSGSFA